MLKIFTEASYKWGFGHLSRMSCVVEKSMDNNIDVALFLDTDGEAGHLFDSNHIISNSWLSTNDEKNLITKEDTVVVDSYHVDIDRLLRIKKMAKYIIVIDDNKRLDYRDSIIINPNYFGEFISYPDGKCNSYYCGKDYTLLRKAFGPPKNRHAKKQADEILISFGGSDIKAMTQHVLRMIKDYHPRLIVHVVATSAYGQLQSIKDQLSASDNLILDATAEQMATLMKQVDFAITSAGGTSNELIKSQCPGLIVPVVDNQTLNAEVLDEYGLAVSSNQIVPETIDKMLEEKTRRMLISNMKEKESTSSASDFIISLCK